MESKPVILFDGRCTLCNRSVQFIIRNDPKGRFRFVAQQSPIAKTLLAPHKIDPAHLDTIVLLEGGRTFTHSEAALRIATQLKSPARYLIIFRMIPRPLRDTLYRWIARHRARWFGRSQTCRNPSETIKERFLTAED